MIAKLRTAEMTAVNESLASAIFSGVVPMVAEYAHSLMERQDASGRRLGDRAIVTNAISRS